ncbi:hypothetical protein B0H17DRAFT_1147329 [Mycena rosella]|uniref:Uncharacterized protein n=1 Tax=Mycena rosella TaxID=1033263 RepID=A0AAD7CPB9_MYCRO|nr:hypothetical protein B0H17DRAFT_1147329 [Mycena rosella]
MAIALDNTTQPPIGNPSTVTFTKFVSANTNTGGNSGSPAVVPTGDVLPANPQNSPAMGALEVIPKHGQSVRIASNEQWHGDPHAPLDVVGMRSEESRPVSTKLILSDSTPADGGLEEYPILELDIDPDELTQKQIDQLNIICAHLGTVNARFTNTMAILTVTVQFPPLYQSFTFLLHSLISNSLALVAITLL